VKLITAIIQPERLDAVKQELYNAEIFKITVSRVRGCGQQKGYSEHYRGQIHKVVLLEKIRLDIAVNDQFEDSTIRAIVKGAKTGNIGDGKIFVTDLARCIRIRTEEEGHDAIG